MALVPIQFNGQLGWCTLAMQSGGVGTVVSVVATASPGTTIVSCDWNAENIGLNQVNIIVTSLQLTNTSGAAVLVTLQSGLAFPPGSALGLLNNPLGTIRLGATGASNDQLNIPVWANVQGGALGKGTFAIMAFAGTTAVVNATALGTLIVGNLAGPV
jgi:hypothetical protein